MRRFQATAKTHVHQAVVVNGAFPPRKPNERSVVQIPQPELLRFCERISLGRCQHQIDRSDFELRQFAIYVGDREHESGIQLARPDCRDLLQRAQWLELQFRVRLPLSELPERVWNDAMPRDALNKSHAQCPGLAGGISLVPCWRLVALM